MHLNDRILAIDDHVENLIILEELLAADYTVRCVGSGEEALRVAPQFQPNLVLLDVMMPGLNGNDTCDLLRATPELSSAKIVMVSARSEVTDRLAAYSLGAVDYITKPFHDQEVLAKVRTWMRMVHSEQVDEIRQDVEKARDAVGTTLAKLASFRDTETGDHLFRVRWYSHALAEQLAAAGPYSRQIDETFLEQLYRASPLHDIGKVGIDDSILRKPGPLTVAEFEAIKHHAVIGSDILAQAAAHLPDADYLKMAVGIARHHHERFDGTGYPDGLAGSVIPLAARIVAVADVFDALTSSRVYRQASSVAEAARTIEANAGSQFDPAVVDALGSRLDDLRQAQGRYANGAPINEVELVGVGNLELCDGHNIDHAEHSFIMLDAVDFGCDGAPCESKYSIREAL
jgi:putative two-component system response regulator